MKILQGIVAFLNELLFPKPMTYEEWTNEVQEMVDRRVRYAPRLKQDLVPNTGEILFNKMQDRQRDL